MYNLFVAQTCSMTTLGNCWRQPSVQQNRATGGVSTCMCVLYMPDVGYRSVVSLDLVCARTCRLLFSAARVHQRSMSHVERGSKVRSGQVGQVFP